jgi:predicted helicase
LSESPINWATYLADDRVVLASKKQPRQHQRDALKCVKDGLAEADRGKLIMACGTGKTYTGLKIAEDMAGVDGRVLYLVPSLSLMSQSIREWSLDAELPLRSLAVCSDAQVGKRSIGKDDIGDIDVHDLAHPAMTNAAKLSAKAAKPAPDRMTVIFATYQSIQVISDAQKDHGLPEFDLVICDEAHRTTGATLIGDDESNFVKIHSQEFIAAKKRIYMTATPRIFADAAKSKASENSIAVCSMDDPELYGETLFQRGFGWAVQNDLLTDYKVVVLVVDEAMVSTSIQNRLTDENSELKLDDATKIIGCYKALTKADLTADVSTDTGHMRRGLAFCKDIASSKLIRDEFSAVVEEYLASVAGDGTEGSLHCELRHVDGTFNAKMRTRELDWLKAEHEDYTARILTNARCLSEGVDVPALDAIMFMHPRKSQIDVVQSVGRVMRRAEGKKMGYVILPIGVPAGMAPEEALNNNEKFRVVWQILNALRAHDERFDATINKMELGADVSSQIEVIAVTNNLGTKKKTGKGSADIGHGSAPSDDDRDDAVGGQDQSHQPSFAFDEFSTAIMAKIVKKCGKRDYWEDWAGDIAKIAQTHITRITAVVQQAGSTERAAFNQFLVEIRDDLNESITEAEAVEMLAQHIITKPVFEALFEGYSFTQNNPVSVAMQSVLNVLHEQNLAKEAEALQKFYASVKMRAAGIDNAAGKQKIIVELYDKFFRNAFPRMTEKLGIVYTPVEVVDFIIHSVNDVLKSEFGQTLGSEGVHILDPFTGTGTFITRLLQSGLISPEQLERKYAEEIHANEIVLLAYYIAAINIEAVYHSVSGGDFKPFEGICLTDTFQLYEKDDLVSGLLADNSSRRQKQKKLDIRVIVGNPPYSVGQGSANDNNANISYPNLDDSIRRSYAAHSTATNKNALYDSYIRAIRWGSERLGERGVMAYVSNAGWVDGDAADGMRKCLAEEFSSLYVFHLRGNQRVSGEQSRKEGGKIFGSGSRAPIAITLFVKNPDAAEHGNIYFHDIGDYLAQTEKLQIVRDFGSIEGIAAAGKWQTITPNEHHDWINQRDSMFDTFLALGDKRESAEIAIFDTYSRGVATGRDVWCYNSSHGELRSNMQRMISFYDSQVDAYEEAGKPPLERFIQTDPAKISWGRGLLNDLRRGKRHQFQSDALVKSDYRPFSKQWLYFDRAMNDMVYRVPEMFPQADMENISFCIIGVPERKGFSVIATKNVPNLHLLDTGQCFPLKVYRKRSEQSERGLFGAGKEEAPLVAIDAISDAALGRFATAYPAEVITKEDIFHYVYGVLHSEEYRERFADNLSKQLPRIPLVKTAKDFWAFAKAGEGLIDLHVNYESAEPYPVNFTGGALFMNSYADADFRVEKMKFGGTGKAKDKSVVIYNSKITMTNIPLEAYDYVVNGKPALEGVMERQTVKTDSDSGIVNDANRYANETVGDPAYPLKVFQRVITVSLETMKIVRSLPALDI